MIPSPDVRALYRIGKTCARLISCRMHEGADEGTALLDTANRSRQSIGEARLAYQFARAVDSIAAECGSRSRTQILSGANPHLTPRMVIRLSRSRPAPLRAALLRAGQGFHPLSKPLATGSPDDLGPWRYDVDRLCRSADLLNGAHTLLPGLESSPKTVGDISLHATAIKVTGNAMLLGLAAPQVLRPKNIQSVGKDVAPGADVLGLLKRARRLVEGATSDMLRAAYHHAPSGEPRSRLIDAIHRVVSIADRIAVAMPRPVNHPRKAPTVVDEPLGSGSAGGTYVLVLKANTGGVIRIGRLDTFWVPAGYVLYVGSAFGGGGVADRTARHRNPDAPLRWNIDYIKRFAHPVELWWAHHDQQTPIECRWAMALAALPGFCCPVPHFGANDCKRCPAHFLRIASRPSCEAFARQLGQEGSSGYTIQRQRLTEK